MKLKRLWPVGAPRLVRFFLFRLGLGCLMNSDLACGTGFGESDGGIHRSRIGAGSAKMEVGA